MRFKGDISGLEELQEQIDDAYFQCFLRLAEMRHVMPKIKRHFKIEREILLMQMADVLSVMDR